MSTASKREELEAAAWRATGPASLPHDQLVDAVLAAADGYASAFAADILDQMHRTRRESDRRDVLAEDEGHARLEAAAAEYWSTR